MTIFLKIYKTLLLLSVNILFLLVGLTIRLIFRKSDSRLKMQSLCSMIWAKTMCRILGIRISIGGHFKNIQPLFTVSNHVSYVDILALASIRPSVFIAKHEIRQWPLLGWLAVLGGTIFIDRNSKRAAWNALFEVERALSSNVNTVLFPEGTTGDGSGLKEFRSFFFDAPIKSMVAVQPVSIKYICMDTGKNHDNTKNISWHGDMQLMQHIWGLLGTKQINTVIYFNPIISRVITDSPSAQSRKILSSAAYISIKSGLVEALS